MMITYDARRTLAVQIQRGDGFMERERRNPSKHRLEEHDMLNWLKANRKKMNAGELKKERVEMFKVLLEAGEKVRRVNQWG